MKEGLALVVLLSKDQILVLECLDVSQNFLRVFLLNSLVLSIKGTFDVHHLVLQTPDPILYHIEKI